MSSEVSCVNLFKYFPHKSYRRYQRGTTNLIHESFKEGISNVVLEGPCGSGKSAIAICLGQYNGNSYLLTSQKVLQEQYIRDYGSDVVAAIMGRNNYQCNQCSRQCDDGICVAGKCPEPHRCPYNMAKDDARDAEVALMNYSYFMHSTLHTDTFGKRDLMVYDEAHCFDTELMRFVQFGFSHNNLSILGDDTVVPELKEIGGYALWLDDIYLDIGRKSKEKESEVKEQNERTGLMRLTAEHRDQEVSNLKKDIGKLSSLKSKVSRFLDSYENIDWVFKYDPERVGVVFKPVEVAPFAQKTMYDFADRHLFMSATILSKNNFCRNVGIDPEKTKFIKVPTTFDPRKRKTYYMNSGDLTFKNKMASLPHIIEDINDILMTHIVERGMIYTHTYEIANYISEHIDPDVKGRLMFHDSQTRASVLEKFLNAEKNEVIVSPSLGEGVDFKDDRARFIIIVKVPWPNTRDPQIKKRQEIDKKEKGNWYAHKAALSLIQTAGRGVRSVDDYCTIYLLDSGFKRFVECNTEFFPKDEYFRQTLREREYG